MIVCLLFGGNLINAIWRYQSTTAHEIWNPEMFVGFHQAAQIRPPPSFAGSQQSWKGTSGVPALSVDQHISWWHGDCRATTQELDVTEAFPNFAKFRLSKVMVDTAKVSQCKFPLVCNVRIQKLQERIQFLTHGKSIAKSPLIWIPKHTITTRCRNKTPITQIKGKFMENATVQQKLLSKYPLRCWGLVSQKPGWCVQLMTQP